MDRTGKIVVGASFALLIAWWLWMQQASQRRATIAATNQPPPTAIAGTNAPGGTNGAAVSAAAVSPSVAPLQPAGPESLLAFENDQLRVTFTSRGGGVKEVELLDPIYRESIPCGPARKLASTNRVRLNRDASSPVLSLGGNLDENGDYRLTRTTNGVRAEKVTAAGLRVVKDFWLGTNFQFSASARLENQSAVPLALPAQEWGAGTATPINPQDNSQWLGVLWFNGQKSYDTLGWVSTPGLFCIPTKPRQDFNGGQSNVVWAAVHNQFFALVTIPDAPATNLVARRVDLPPPPRDQLDNPHTVSHPAGAQATLVFPAVTLEPGQAIERQFSFYAGPKQYLTLSRLEPRLDLVMDYTGITGPFAKGLLLAMNGLHGVGLGYGLCIIAITVIIKLLFWPLTAASTKSMKRMQQFQPQLKAIQEKYKADPKKLNEKTLQFMREHKINPAAGCLPVFIQIPVFFGLFTMLRSAIELRGAGFLWMCDLSAPDTLFVIPGLGWIPIIGVAGVGLPFNLMPLLYIATALWQSHMTPMSPQMDPAQQKMMKYMPLAFLLLFYNYSCGLALYWTVSNLLTILQMKVTRNEPAAPAPGAAAPTSLLKRRR